MTRLSSERTILSRAMVLGAHNPIFILLVTSLSFYFVDIAGQVYVSEILLVICSVHALMNVRRSAPLPAWVVPSCVLWAFGSLLSDLAANSDLISLARGQARVFFLLTNIYALNYLLRNRERAISLAWVGMLIAAGLTYVLSNNQVIEDLYWKFAFGLPITIVIMIWISIREMRIITSLMVILPLAVVHFALGARSLAVITIISSLLLVVRSKREVALSGRSVPFRPFLLAVAGLTLIVGIISLYDRLAISGAFGSIAQQKAQYQATGEFGSFLSGRNEFLLSAQVIKNNPILGGGSYSAAPLDVRMNTATFLNDLGYQSLAQRLLTDTPAYHSELLGSWAENGVLSLPFWLALFVFYLLALVKVLYRSCRWPAVVAVLSTSGLWDVLFSPFGADRRMWLALSFITILTLTQRRASTANADIYSYNQLQSARLPTAMSRKRGGPGLSRLRAHNR